MRTSGWEVSKLCIVILLHNSKINLPIKIEYKLELICGETHTAIIYTTHSEPSATLRSKINYKK